MNYISQQEPNQMWIKKVLMLVLADILIVLISYLMALLLRFDFVFSSIPEEYLMGYLWSMPFWIISTIVIFYICRLYHSIWRLASVAELQMILIAYSILAVVYSLGMLFMKMHMPRSYYFIGLLLNFLMTTGLRFSYRLMRFWVNSRNTNADAGDEMHAKDHVMVIGAGAAGQALIKEIINSKKLNTQVVCIIDDNPTKHGRVLEGITIVGDRYSIPEMAKKYKVDRIIYAIPAAAADDRKAILNICKDTGCRLQTVPGVYQLVNGEVSVSRLRNVEITDLLGRAQVQVNMDEIYSSIQGKTLLVTGGGGSIGSELCRQIAASHPKKLIIFDMYENNAYEIQQELRRKYGDSLDLEVLIGSVRNTNRIRSIMQKYKPDIVFHAAAHKHVPLMEDSPNEAIKNNVMGTYKTAVAASRAGVKKFVLISTDKAVNPTNIMGEASAFQHVYVWSDVWQHAGWDSIIYIAALAAVDPSLYEAATVDGASKIQRLWHIDLPFLIPTAVILLIMRAGNVMNLGFEKVYLMQNPLNTSISEVISTYVYKIGMISNQYSLSAAVNLFNTVINFVLLILVNGFSKKLGDTSLW